MTSTEQAQPFRPSMVEVDLTPRGWCSVIIGDDDSGMPVYCQWVAAFACENYAGLLVCAEHYDMRQPRMYAITRRGATTLHGAPRLVVQLDKLLDRLDIEDDDAVRADLLEEVFAMCEYRPDLAQRARESGIPT